MLGLISARPFTFLIRSLWANVCENASRLVWNDVAKPHKRSSIISQPLFLFIPQEMNMQYVTNKICLIIGCTLAIDSLIFYIAFFRLKWLGFPNSWESLYTKNRMHSERAIKKMQFQMESTIALYRGKTACVPVAVYHQVQGPKKLIESCQGE